MVIGDHTYLYNNRKDGRTMFQYIDEDGKHRIRSYPRILMEEKLGRPLRPDEDVHHIDGDKTNNSIENLEIIPHGVHQKLHNPPKYHDMKVKCCICGKEFIYTTKQVGWYIRDKRIGRRRGITCSRKCAYKFGMLEQVKSNLDAECGLNGEASPNGNAVPNTNNKN